MKTSTTLQAASLVMASVAAADFGVTKSGSNYVVDAGSSNPFSITIAGSSCDVTSIKYRGNELQASGGKTQIGSGLGSATVNAATVKSGSTNFVKVTCETSTLTHYIIVKEGEATMYMGTYITAEPSIGELRYLARLNAEILPYEYPFGEASNTAGASSTVEGSDVFIVDGQTRSKFYSSSRFIDTDVYCAYGNSTEAIHACFLPMNKEASSGGPFHRDINSNRAAEDTVNLSWYMNSGHVKTEDFRVGLNGPYLLSFSRSGIPKAAEVDTSFFADMDIKGYVADSARGTVTGKATGVSSSFEAVVHWFNDDAQYWTKASSDGSFTSPNMIPGTYTMVLYQTEYKVANATVTVSAGKSTTQNIASTLTAPANSLFKIGEFDGQPFELLNGDKFLRMHPSDSRMSSWTPGTFTVGTSKDNEFPMALFKSVNNGQISFNLDSAPGAATLRIATTLSANGGRPSVSVNGWAASAPAAPVKIDSRGVTRGAYRGYGEQYDIAIPAGKLVAGANNITIGVLSGSTGTGFLNPSFIVDAIELFNNDASSKATSASASTNSAATSSVTEKAEDVTTSKSVASGTNVATKAVLPTGILTFTNDTATSAALSTGYRHTTLQTVVSATSATLTGSSGSSSTAVSTSAAATKTKSACKAKRSGLSARRRAVHA